MDERCSYLELLNGIGSDHASLLCDSRSGRHLLARHLSASRSLGLDALPGSRQLHAHPVTSITHTSAWRSNARDQMIEQLSASKRAVSNTCIFFMLNKTWQGRALTLVGIRTVRRWHSLACPGQTETASAVDNRQGTSSPCLGCSRTGTGHWSVPDRPSSTADAEKKTQTTE